MVRKKINTVKRKIGIKKNPTQKGAGLDLQSRYGNVVYQCHQ